MKKTSGFTLMEIMIAIGIAGILSLMIATHLSTINKTKKDFENVMEAESDFAELYQDIRNISERSREYGVSYLGAAPPSGYLIYGEGAIGFRADISPCNTFSPVAPIFTPVTILCCKKNMTTSAGLIPAFTIPQTLPPGGTPGGIMAFAPMTSACTKSDGLSIQRGASKICFPHITEMRLSKVGHHSSYGTDLLLLEIKTNRSLTGATTDTLRGLSMFFGLGYSGSSSVTFCSKTLGLGK